MAGPCTAAITSSESGVEGVVLKVLHYKAKTGKKEEREDKGSYIRTMPNEEK